MSPELENHLLGVADQAYLISVQSEQPQLFQFIFLGLLRGGMTPQADSRIQSILDKVGDQMRAQHGHA